MLEQASTSTQGAALILVHFLPSSTHTPAAPGPRGRALPQMGLPHALGHACWTPLSAFMVFHFEKLPFLLFTYCILSGVFFFKKS